MTPSIDLAPVRPPLSVTPRHAGRAALLAAVVASTLGCAPAALQAREGVEVGKRSVFVGLVPAEKLEAAADQQYLQLASEAKQKGALVEDNHPQVIRLRAIA